MAKYKVFGPSGIPIFVEAEGVSTTGGGSLYLYDGASRLQEDGVFGVTGEQVIALFAPGAYAYVVKEKEEASGQS